MGTPIGRSVTVFAWGRRRGVADRPWAAFMEDMERELCIMAAVLWRQWWPNGGLAGEPRWSQELACLGFAEPVRFPCLVLVS